MMTIYKGKFNTEKNLDTDIELQLKSKVNSIKLTAILL